MFVSQARVVYGPRPGDCEATRLAAQQESSSAAAEPPPSQRNTNQGGQTELVFEKHVTHSALT
jgi:hypothetical protein